MNNDIPPEDMMAGNFEWFTGVVEDIMDPEQRGRVRVRCFGYHTEDKSFIPTAALPWSHVMMPVTSASTSGVGRSATGIVRGTWVVGFFRDGAVAQDPIIMGTLPSKTGSVNYEFGFSDPQKQYPYESKVDDQDIPEEAIDKDDKFKDSFSYKKKEEHRKLGPTPIALANDDWALPPVDEIIKPQYPKNHVWAYEREVEIEEVDTDVEETDGLHDKDTNKQKKFDGDYGLDPKKTMHVDEHDVTPGYERISSMHKSGTYREWTPKGDETVVIVGDEYRIVAKDQMINIKGDAKLTIEGDYHRLVMGNEFIHVKGNRKEVVDGNFDHTTGKSLTQTIGKDFASTIGENSTVQIGKNHSLTTAGNVILNTGGIKTDTIAASPGKTTICESKVFVIKGVPIPIGPSEISVLPPQGPAGPQGIQGIQGGQGIQGVAGTDGQDGQDGAPGQDGQDGAPGQDGQDGAPGQDGADGLGWTNGSYNPATGIVTFTSDDGLGFSTGDLRGTDGNDGEDGLPGQDGADGTDGSTWITGSTTPNDTLGLDGDLYLNTTNGDVYEKVSGTWGSPIANIAGQDGTNGQDGADGTDGATWFSGNTVPDNGVGSPNDFYFDTSTRDVYKKSLANEWGSPIANLRGDDGAAGTDGTDGTDGLSTFQISIFQRSASAPATPTRGLYDFSTMTLTPPSDWTIETPAGTDPIWVSHTIASVIGTGIDTTLTWTAPIQFVSNGADGVDGDPGYVTSVALASSPAGVTDITVVGGGVYKVEQAAGAAHKAKLYDFVNSSLLTIVDNTFHHLAFIGKRLYRHNNNAVWDVVGDLVDPTGPEASIPRWKKYTINSSDITGADAGGGWQSTIGLFPITTNGTTSNAFIQAIFIKLATSFTAPSTLTLSISNYFSNYSLTGTVAAGNKVYAQPIDGNACISSSASNFPVTISGSAGIPTGGSVNIWVMYSQAAV